MREELRQADTPRQYEPVRARPCAVPQRGAEAAPGRVDQETSSNPRSCARHRPRVGPMLPTGSPS